MLVNIDYGQDYDVLYLPNGENDPVELHQSFLNWLYDKKSKHPYRVTLENGETVYKYDASAFVEWLNENVFLDEEKAKIAEKFADSIDESNVTIGF